ncbi:MAG: GntR family transcriptional regulator [Fusobacteriaceae bacterium]
MKNVVRNYKENTRSYVYRVIKENIMYLQLKPGQNVSEVEFSEKLGVSRTPVREAIVKLSDEKLIDVYPQRGTFVSKIDLEAVEEAFYTRNLIEKDILKLAIKKFDKTVFKELEKNIYLQKGNLDLEGDTIERFYLDNEFHRIIYSATGKSRTWNAIKYMSTHYDRLRFLDVIEGKTLNKTVDQHNRILNVIKNKDESIVENIVDEHLANYKDEIEVFKEKYPDYFL